LLTAQDDLSGHQLPHAFAVTAGGDPRFTERYWYTAHPIDGTDLLFDDGGYYPNKGVRDAFLGHPLGDAYRRDFPAPERPPAAQLPRFAPARRQPSGDCGEWAADWGISEYGVAPGYPACAQPQKFAAL
jgi:hypothetical protein